MSRTLKIQLTFVTFLTLFALVSCNKEESFPVQIINHSGYDINSLSFHGVVSGESIAIEGNDTSDILILSYEKRLRLTPKLLGISVDSFNPQGSVFSQVNRRSSVPFSKKDLNEDVNSVVISSDENSDTLSFSVTLQ